ncbi:hypothetical protein EV715DRAFT_298386 [Schizophyllum commune]
MAVYTLSFFFGPIVGPLVSGFINQHANWRWIFRVLIIWVVKAGVVARSSHLEVPTTSTVVQMFLLELQVRTDGILADGKLMSEYKHDYWSCCRHEVAMRGYQNDLIIGLKSVINKK